MDGDAPHPVGTVVTGRDSLGLPLSESCADHLWQITSDPSYVDNSPGWLQRARCLFCQWGSSPWVNGSFFTQLPTDDQFDRFRRLVEVRIEELNQLYDGMFLFGEDPEIPEGLARVAQMRDFG